MALTAEFDIRDVMDGLGRIDAGKSQALIATRSDFRTRAHTAVERGVKAHYKVEEGRVRKDKKSWRNTGPYSGEQEYSSSPIGVDHFGMAVNGPFPQRSSKRVYVKDKKFNGLARTPLPYSVSFNVKGAGSVLGGGGTPYFIWQEKGFLMRRTSDQPTPIERITTLSVAAMITNDAKNDVQAQISKFLEERFEYHVKRFTGLG